MGHTVRVLGVILIIALFLLAGLLAVSHSEYSFSINRSPGTKAPADLRLENHLDPAPQFYNMSDVNVPIIDYRFRATGGTAAGTGDIQGINVTHIGSGSASDITTVYLYVDADNDNEYEPGGDDGSPLGQNSTWTSNRAYLSLSPVVGIAKNFGKNVYVVFDFSSTANGTHGVQLTSINDVTASVPVLDPNTFTPLDSRLIPRWEIPTDYNLTNPTVMIESSIVEEANCGDTLEFKIKASHVHGPGSIMGVNLTLTGPGDNKIFSEVNMTPGGTGADWKDFNHTFLIPGAPNALARGNYTLNFTGWFAQGERYLQHSFNITNTPPQITGTIGPFYKQEEDEWDEDLSGKWSDMEDIASAVSWKVTSIDTMLMDVIVDGHNLTFKLVEDAFGEDELTLTLTDSDGDSASVNFWVYVASVNDPPEIKPDISDQKADEDDDPWELDLTYHKYDKEDGPPQETLVWSVSDINESLFTAKVEGDIITFSPKPDAFGKDEINITLTDSGTARDWQWVEVEIKPVNDAPRWKKIKDINLNKYSELKKIIDLKDFATDIDDISLVFGLEGTDADKIKVTLDDSNTLNIELLDPTFNGTILVTATVFDGDDSAETTFNITYEQTVTGKALAYLTSPADGGKVDILGPELMWDVDLPADQSSKVTFSLYLGKDKQAVTRLNESVLLANDLTDSYFTTSGLEDLTTYYWTVIPVLEGVRGICVSGTFSFSVDTTFEIIHRLGFTAEPDTVTLKRGDVVNISLTVTNLGNDQEILLAGMDLGDFPGIALFSNSGSSIQLGPNESQSFQVVITANVDAPPEIYDLTFTVETSSGSDNKSAVVQVVVITDSDPGEDSILGWVLSSILGVIILLILFFIIIGVIIFLVVYLRGNAKVDAIYVINIDGRLMFSRERPQEGEESVDGEILSGMFTAIQDLIDDTFQTEGGEGKTKKKIEFGGKNILIQRGKDIYLVLVAQGRPGKLMENDLESILVNIEKDHPGLEEWDGDRDELDIGKHFDGYLSNQ